MARLVWLADGGDNDELVTEGFAAPVATALPVQDDQYEELCRKAGEVAITVAFLPLEELGLPSKVRSALDGPMGELIHSLSAWFCGDGKNSLPDLRQYVDQGYPIPNSVKGCKDSTGRLVRDDNLSLEQIKKTAMSSTRECLQLESETLAAKPDARGYCQTDCGLDGPYERAVAEARQACDPSQNPRPNRYNYQKQRLRLAYHWDGDRWKRGEPESSSVRFRPYPVSDLDIYSLNDSRPKSRGALESPCSLLLTTSRWLRP